MRKPDKMNRERFINAIESFTQVATRDDNLKLAVYSAELVLPDFELKYPKNNHSKKAIDAAKKCIQNDTQENRDIACVEAGAYSGWAREVPLSPYHIEGDHNIGSYHPDYTIDSSYYAAVSCAAAAASKNACASHTYNAANYASTDNKTKQKIIKYALNLSEDWP